MWRLVTTAACTFVLAILVPEFGFAQCATDPLCTAVQFRDALGLKKCLQKKLDLCSGKPEEQEKEMDKLAGCLTTEEPFSKLMFIFLDGLRQVIFLAARLIFPGSTQVLYDILMPIPGGSNRHAHRSRPFPTPDACHHKINVSVPQNIGINQCVRFVESFCHPGNRRDFRVLTGELLSALVCILRNIPTDAALQLLKKFMCNLLKKLLEIVQVTKAAPLLEPLLNLMRLLLRCEPYKPIGPLAERTLLQK